MKEQVPWQAPSKSLRQNLIKSQILKAAPHVHDFVDIRKGRLQAVLRWHWDPLLRIQQLSKDRTLHLTISLAIGSPVNNANLWPFMTHLWPYAPNQFELYNIARTADSILPIFAWPFWEIDYSEPTHPTFPPVLPSHSRVSNLTQLSLSAGRCEDFQQLLLQCQNGILMAMAGPVSQVASAWAAQT